MTMTKVFFGDPMSVAKHFAICPPSDLGGYTGQHIHDINTSAIPMFGAGPGRDSVKFERIAASRKVIYMELFKDSGGVGNNEGRDVLRFNAQEDPFGDARPIYFLPWDSGGAVVQLTIPRKGVRDEDPDIFFTAAINGCSVFVQGTPQQPTIYHGGGDTGRSDHQDAARFWRQAVKSHIDGMHNVMDGQVHSEVNKTHYIKTPGTVANSSTPRAEAYEKLLKDELEKRGKFQVQMVNPWGCVFGIRTGEDWEFYLQENATVICQYISRRSVETRYYARPMQLNKIFPGAPSRVSSMAHTVPVKIV